MNKLLYGVAYYDEYMPCDRLAKDVEMMKAAGINLVRIAESTWSTCEPQEGVFDFSHVIRVLDAMEEAGISVIIGTPTYAIPSGCTGNHKEGARHLRGASDHGYHTSGISLLWGTGDPETDGGVCTQKMCHRLPAG